MTTTGAPHVMRHSEIDGDGDVPTGPQLRNSDCRRDTADRQDLDAATYIMESADVALDTAGTKAEIATGVESRDQERHGHGGAAIDGTDVKSDVASTEKESDGSDGSGETDGKSDVASTEKDSDGNGETDVEPQPLKENSDGSSTIFQAPGHVMNVDHGMLLLVRRHPFRFLAASPLLLISTVSLVVCTVSGMLGYVIMHPGEESNETKRSVEQDDQTKQRITTLKEIAS